MLLFMFLQVAHVQILLVTAFDLAHIFPASLFVLQMYLYVLFQVCSCREGLTAFFANERLLLGVDATMTVEIGLLVEFLIALIEVTFIGSSPSVDQLMSLQSRAYIELTFAIIDITPVLSVFPILMAARRDANVKIFMTSHTVIILRGVLFTCHVSADR